MIELLKLSDHSFEACTPCTVAFEQNVTLGENRFI